MNKDYAALGKGFSGTFDTFEEAQAVVEKNKNGTVYERIHLCPSCERCNDSMIPQHYEDKIIGWNCGNCWETWTENGE